MYGIVLGCLLASSAAYASNQEYVYVESNIQTPNGNSIFVFQRNADQTLTQIPGSPFLTGGSGVQDTTIQFGPYDTDQNVIVDEKRKLLFAVNSGSSSIAVFHIQNNGSLVPVSGSPFPSGGEAGGIDPVSVGLAGDILFVVDADGDPGNPGTVLPLYTAFRVASDGTLSPLSDSTVSVAMQTDPSQALTVPGQHLLFGDDFLGGLIQSFRYDDDGHLHQNPPTAFPASEYVGNPAPRVALGLITHPYLPILYAGMPTVERLAVFQYNERGHLTFVRSVPELYGSAICWLRPNHAGTRLYTSNQGSFTTSSTLSVYDLTNPLNPVEIQSITPIGQSNATQIELSNDGQNLYMVSEHFNTTTPASAGKSLHIFSIAADGTLSETVAPILLNVPDGAQPQGVAVFTVQ
jgi:6-phosphogluconolactonase (cycloisomerase 2 family)